MELYPKVLEQLNQHLSALPGIGRRTAERLSIALLEWDENQLQQFGELLCVLKDRVKFCTTCGNLTEEEKCGICLDPKRNQQLICVVENPKQIPAIIKCGRFDGVFHVLGGRISPLDNMKAEDLNIDSLFDRIQYQEVKEILISTSPDVEGQATAIYLAEEIKGKFDIIITRIALGLPIGSDLMYADPETMAMAIESRRSINS